MEQYVSLYPKERVVGWIFKQNGSETKAQLKEKMSKCLK